MFITNSKIVVGYVWDVNNVVLNESILSEIAHENVDVDKYAIMTVEDSKLRAEIIQLMLNDHKIMIYYHSYYIINRASQKKPELFYKYWDDFASWINHENSYHRDFGLTLIANLTSVDNENKFPSILNGYLKCINDPKFMTSRHCIQNTSMILKNKKEYREVIINILLDIDNLCDYTKKQLALLKSDIIVVLDTVYTEIKDKNEINKFLNDQLTSISPKTKKLAREFISKYEINKPSQLS